MHDARILILWHVTCVSWEQRQTRGDPDVRRQLSKNKMLKYGNKTSLVQYGKAALWLASRTLNRWRKFICSDLGSCCFFSDHRSLRLSRSFQVSHFGIASG